MYKRYDLLRMCLDIVSRRAASIEHYVSVYRDSAYDGVYVCMYRSDGSTCRVRAWSWLPTVKLIPPDV